MRRTTMLIAGGVLAGFICILVHGLCGAVREARGETSSKYNSGIAAGRMRLIEGTASSPQKTCQVKGWFSAGEARLLMKNPPDVAGVGYLLRSSQPASEFFVYVPALRKTKHIVENDWYNGKVAGLPISPAGLVALMLQGSGEAQGVRFTASSNQELDLDAAQFTTRALESAK